MPMQLTFQGQLLNTEQGKNAPEFGGAEFTAMEFSAVGSPVFKLRADGHIDLTAYLRQEREWALEVAPKVSGGKVSFKVLKIGGGKAAKS